MRYFLELSYLGTHYHGWQRQPNASSVQQTLEETLTQLLREPVELTGAGRTDTGVHASHYVAHFDSQNNTLANSSTPVSAQAAADFLYHANSMLPPDIALSAIRPVPDSAHARFDALSRTYTYYIITRKDPFRSLTAWHYPTVLDIEKMNTAADNLVTASDFTSFAKLHSANKTNICHVTQAHWQQTGDSLTFTISADRFLRNMVRSIVGTLVDVGRGKISPQKFAEILAAKDLSLSSAGAPAHGLFLSDIKY